MIRKLQFLLLTTLLIACNNGQSSESDQKLDSLRIENEKMKNLVQELKSQQNKTKYVWTIIHNKRGKYIVSSSSGKTGFEGPIKDFVYYSDVITVDEFNEDKKYILQDELEKDLRKQFGSTIYSIESRETFEFDSYKEASKHRYTYVN